MLSCCCDLACPFASITLNIWILSDPPGLLTTRLELLILIRTPTINYFNNARRETTHANHRKGLLIRCLLAITHGWTHMVVRDASMKKTMLHDGFHATERVRFAAQSWQTHCVALQKMMYKTLAADFNKSSRYHTMSCRKNNCSVACRRNRKSTSRREPVAIA